LEQQAAHVLIVMLPGMDENLCEQIRMFGECGDDRRHLYQIGPRTDDVDDLHVCLSAARFTNSPTTETMQHRNAISVKLAFCWGTRKRSERKLSMGSQY